VRLTGRLHRTPEAEAAVVAVHGLGGSIESEYMLTLAAAAREVGWSCLRLNLRGSDRAGDDFYHAGLTEDLHAALASPELAGMRDLYLVGFSMGGHVVLRAATEDMNPRVRAVAAVCSPLDLAPCQAAFDRPQRWLYRRYVLASLVEIYRGVAARRSVPVPVEEAARITTVWEWDEKIVAPRWGFDGPDDYYARASVAPRLGELRVPALLVQAQGDPFVADASVRPALESLAGEIPLTAHWVSPAGHMGFPEQVDLGVEAPLGLEPQILGWLRQRTGPHQDGFGIDVQPGVEREEKR